MKTRFSHRFSEPNLTEREWIKDISIDKELGELENLLFIPELGSDALHDFVVKHYFYCGATSPSIEIYFEKGQLEKELNCARAGDIIEVWVLIERKPQYYKLRCPNEDGLFPMKGVY